MLVFQLQILLPSLSTNIKPTSFDSNTNLIYSLCEASVSTGCVDSRPSSIVRRFIDGMVVVPVQKRKALTTCSGSYVKCVLANKIIGLHCTFKAS